VLISELVNDGIIVKQQKESTPDDPEDKYEATQKLGEICKTLGIVVYHFNTV
jgi:DNA-binding HxlR family transcriptional regulator